jgi:hypothetical protein
VFRGDTGKDDSGNRDYRNWERFGNTNSTEI